MSSWSYVFLFPQSQSSLVPGLAVNCFTRGGFDLDDTIRLALPVDAEGHLLDVGSEVRLEKPFNDSVARHLDAAQSFSLQARNRDIALSVQLFLKCPNPHISVGWSRNLFDRMGVQSRAHLWATLRVFAKECQAAYVLVVDDAPDHFEDRFVENDGERVLDLTTTHPYGHRVREIWIRPSTSARLPLGVPYGQSADIGDGYIRYEIAQ